MEVTDKKQINFYCSYLPASVFHYMKEYIKEAEVQKYFRQTPLRHSYETAFLYVKVSRLTDYGNILSRQNEREGGEQFASHLNSYFKQLVNIVVSHGGDLLKFSSDSLMILWPPTPENLTAITRRAAQCAIEITARMHNVRLNDTLRVSFKAGIGAGTATIVYLGGLDYRMEYFTTGLSVLQAFHAEERAKAGQIVASPEAWSLIKKFFVCKKSFETGYIVVAGCKDSLGKLNVHLTASTDSSMSALMLTIVSRFMPSVVLPNIDSEEDKWISENRRVTVVSVNFGFNRQKIAQVTLEESSRDLFHIEQIMESIQCAIYRNNGFIQKFTIDRDGAILVGVFMISAAPSNKEAGRSLHAALVMCDRLHELGYSPSLGLATGTAFCGFIGSDMRRQYCVLGDVTRLSTQMMQYAARRNGGILCDEATQSPAQSVIKFRELENFDKKDKYYKKGVYEVNTSLVGG